MKIKLVSIAMVLALSAGFNASAVNIDNTAMNVERSEFKRGHKMKSHISALVHEYMLKQGDITQGEIDILKEERKADHAALKAFKQAGDTYGLDAKKAELKTKREERRTAMKQYIDDNEALKTKIEEKKQKFKNKHSQRKEHRKGNRKENRKNNSDRSAS